MSPKANLDKPFLAQPLESSYRRIRAMFSLVGGPTRLQASIWVVFVASSIIISLRDFRTFQVGAYRDDARYVVLAESILARQFGLVYGPGEPEKSSFPFGFPLLLASMLAVFPGNLAALKTVSLVATVANAGIIFWGWRWYIRNRSHWWALAVSGLYIFSPLTINHSRQIMAEPVFTTFCLAALAVAERMAGGRFTVGLAITLGALLAGAVFTRTIGIVLIAAAFAYLILRLGRKAWRVIGLGLVSMALVVGVFAVTIPLKFRDILPVEYLGDASAYFLTRPFELLFMSGSGQPGGEAAPEAELDEEEAAADLKTILVDNLLIWGVRQHLGEDIRVVAVPIGGGLAEQAFANRFGLGALPSLLGYAISAIVIFGVAWSAYEERGSLLHLFALAYFVSLFLWVSDERRLLYPVLPQLFLGLLIGLDIMAAAAAKVVGWLVRGSQVMRRSLVVSAAVLLLIASVYKSLRIEDSRLHVGDMAARTEWLRVNSVPSDIIMTEEPEIDYLYSGRWMVRTPWRINSLNQLSRFLADNHVRFVLVAPPVDWHKETYIPTLDDRQSELLALVNSADAANKLVLVHTSPTHNVQVFEVIP